MATRASLERQIKGASPDGVVVQQNSTTFVKRTLQGTANKIDITNGDGVAGDPTIDVGSEVGDVFGPAISNDQGIARFNGVTGKIIEGSGVFLDDFNNISFPVAIQFDNTGGIRPISTAGFYMLIQGFNTGGAVYDNLLKIENGTPPTIKVLDDIPFYFGDSGDFSISFSTVNAPNAAIFSLPNGGVAPGFLHICEDGDKAFNWLNGSDPTPGTGPTLFLHSENQVRNQFTFIQQNDDNLTLQTSGGDDVDGTTQNQAGLDLVLSTGNGGTLGGLPGDVVITTGDGVKSNVDGGFLLATLGDGSNSDGVTPGGGGGSYVLLAGDGGALAGAQPAGDGGDIDFVAGGPGGTGSRFGRISLRASGQVIFTADGTAQTTTGFYRLRCGTQTTLTADTEAPSVYIEPTSATGFQWTAGGGAFTNQRFIQFRAPTVRFTAADTITNAANVYVEGAPIASTNATLTNRYSLWVDADSSRFDGRVLNAQGTDIASANDLTLGNDGNFFAITGATQLNAITTAGWTAGTPVTLKFTGAPTVKHNTAGGAGTAALLLAGSVDLSAAANTILGLIYDGTNWQETFRKVA